MRRILVGGIAGCGMLVAGCFAAPAGAAAPDWYGRWMVQQARPAPWVTTALSVELGAERELVLAADMAGVPGLPVCTAPRYTELAAPPEGLFEGGLDEGGHAAASARTLGFPDGTVRSLRIECPNSSIDLHAADDDTLLFARDNVLYSVSRSAGALAAPGTPEAAVQALLQTHFGEDMGFTEVRWNARAPALSEALQQALAGYFSADWPEDEVPPINGDPLTDSQEYPTRFAVGTARVEAGRTRVPVQFADGWTAWSLSLELVEESGWKLDDVIGRDGSRLRESLALRP